MSLNPERDENDSPKAGAVNHFDSKGSTRRKIFEYWLFAEILVIVLIVTVIYGSFITGLDNDFTFDDHLAIDGNHDVVGKEYDPYLWFHDIWGKDLLEHDSHKSYRPLLILIFHYLWNYESKASVFRIVSIGLHGCTTYAVYRLTRSVFREHDGKFLISIAATLFFATHPIHVESVTAVVNLAEPASALCIIVAYLLFQNIFEQLLEPSSSNFLFTFNLFLWTVFIIIAILLKETGIIALLLCIAYTSVQVFSFLVYHLVVSRKLKQAFPSDSKSRLLAAESAISVQRRRVLFAGMSLLFVNGGLVYLYFVMREIITSPDRITILTHPAKFLNFILFFLFRNKGAISYLNSSQLIRRAENPFAFIRGTERILSYLYLYYRYFALLVYPKEQSPEYSYNCIPTIKDLQDPRNYLSTLLLLVLVLLIIVGFILLFRCIFHAANEKIQQLGREQKKETGKKFDYISSYDNNTDGNETKNVPAEGGLNTEHDLSIACLKIIPPVVNVPLIHALFWTIIPFIPLTGIIFTLGTLLAERLLYLCSIGYCLLLAWLLFIASSFLTRNHKGSKLILFSSIAIGVIAYFTFQTREYNLAWRNDDALFFHALKVCPNFSKINLQVAKIYINHQNYYKAMKRVEQAKILDPEFCDIEYTEALILLSQANEDVSLSSSGSHSTKSNFVDSYEDKIEEAMQLCLKNLQCIFTNKQSYKLLQDLWSHQVSYVENKLSTIRNYLAVNKPSASSSASSLKTNSQFFYYENELEKTIEEKIDLFERQGNLAEKHNLTILAIQKYADIGVFAFEQKRFKKTFTLLKRGNDAMDRLLHEHNLPWDIEGFEDLHYSFPGLGNAVDQLSSTMGTNIRFLQCRIAGLTATLRSAVIADRKNNPDYEEVIQKLPKRAFLNTTMLTVLQNATSTVCLKSILPSPTLLKEQILNKPTFLSTLQHEKNGQKSLFMDHIRLSNSHFLQLLQSKFFSMDVMTVLSNANKIINSTLEEERFTQEVIRQLTLGFALEVTAKEWSQQDSWLKVRKVIEAGKASEDLNAQWDFIADALRTVQEVSFLENQKGLKKNSNEKSNNILLQLVHIWSSLASQYYSVKDFARAANYYALLLSFFHALQHRNMELFTAAFVPLTSSWGRSSKNVEPEISVILDKSLSASANNHNRNSLRSHTFVWKDSAQSLLFTYFSAKLLKQESAKFEFVKSSVFAHWVYYYADSLVGVEGFYENPDAVWLVAKLLAYYESTVKLLRQQKGGDKRVYPDVEVIHGLAEKFRKTYCHMTDSETQDYELCAFS